MTYNRENRVEKEIGRLAADSEFAKRTARAVIARSEPMSKTESVISPIKKSPYIAMTAAAAAMLLALLLMREIPATKQYFNGLSETTAATLVSENESETYWNETDSVILSSFAIR